jgi:hypothetical protein
MSANSAFEERGEDAFVRGERILVEFDKKESTLGK